MAIIIICEVYHTYTQAMCQSRAIWQRAAASPDFATVALMLSINYLRKVKQSIVFDWRGVGRSVGLSVWASRQNEIFMLSRLMMLFALFWATMCVIKLSQLQYVGWGWEAVFFSKLDPLEPIRGVSMKCACPNWRKPLLLPLYRKNATWKRGKFLGHVSLKLVGYN